MLETVDLSQKLGKEDYKEWFPRLKEDLRRLQQEVREAGIPVVILFEGWDASGKGDSISQLVDRLDPRGFRVHPISAPLPEELYRPFLWRFWTKAPGRGQIGIFDRSWYGRVMVERVDKLCTPEQWHQAYQEINEFERQLVDDGTIIVKLWLHISKKEQKKRFKQCEKDPFMKWKVTKEDWKHYKQYKTHLQVTEEMLERTSTHYAPWTIVEATDRRFRRVKIFKTIVEAVQAALNKKRSQAATHEDVHKQIEVAALKDMPSVLDRVDLSLSFEREEYQKKLLKGQVRLRELEFECFKHRMPVIVVYEGWDAGGKGGNIKRVTQNLDPRGYSVTPIAAPSGEEKTHHYLWRFWNQIPKAGHIAVFDRSWYGRVMVERIEGFCTTTEWRRAFQEINEFERQLYHFGMVIVKFWLHISKEEQLRRFEERKTIDYKAYKLTDEDWRNRERWDQYREAVVEMLQRTSTTCAPWTVVEGNCKWWARVKSIETIIEAIEKGLKRTDRPKMVV
ncbi:MAG: phosphate--AMP phosphotransferase [bacterium]